MSTRSKSFFALFLISAAMSVFLWFAAGRASARLFLGGLGHLIMLYFAAILSLVFLGLGVANLSVFQHTGTRPTRDISAWVGIIGLILFGISYLPLDWFVMYGAGVPSTLFFVGVLLMLFGVIDIIRKHFKTHD